MITTSDTIKYDSEGTTTYIAPTTVCIPRYNPLSTNADVELSVQNATTHVQVASYVYTYTYSQINAQSITETTTVEIFMQAIQKLVKATLEGLNGGATFTIV